MALLVTWLGGWLYTIVLAYVTGDPTAKLASPIKQPVAQIFYDVLGRRAGIFFTIAAYIVLNFTAMTAIHAGSRTIWAYARDEMLPLSPIWYKINRRTDTPVYAVWLFTTCCVLINLIGLGSYTAISAIFNLTAIALDWSYVIPIICKMLFGRFERGPFHLGRFSWWINLYASIWTFFVTIIYVQPTILPVTPQNVSVALTFMQRRNEGMLMLQTDELRFAVNGGSSALCDHLLVRCWPVLLCRTEGEGTVGCWRRG